MSSDLTGPQTYFDPPPARWPLAVSAALLLMAVGGATWLNRGTAGPYILVIGAAVLIVMLFDWFSALIGEGRAGLYSDRVEGAVRTGLAWFIFSEVHSRTMAQGYARRIDRLRARARDSRCKT